jgi:CheY-like chemotaxis protein
MIVDDEPEVVDIYKEMLERLGYSADPHTNSVAALEAFKANPDDFDLILTDLTMPLMAGNRLVNELINIKPELPVVLCSGFGPSITQDKANDLNIKAFLSKPVNTSELAQTIRSVLDGKK